jgi:hypothetical protein
MCRARVKKILGHRSINSTLIYTHLIDFQTDDYITKVAKTADEACHLLEAGFEYICTTPDALMLFRKRK